MPAYAYPEAASPGAGPGRPLRHLAAPAPGTMPEFADVRAGLARSIVASFLARMPGGGWLSAEEADGVLRCYGLPMVEFRRVADADAAVRTRRPDWAVTWRSRLTCPACCDKTVAGAVELDLHGADEVRAAMGRLQARFAGGCPGCWSSP